MTTDVPIAFHLWNFITVRTVRHPRNRLEGEGLARKGMVQDSIEGS